jgi:hypothetical protein
MLTPAEKLARFFDQTLHDCPELDFKSIEQLLKYIGIPLDEFVMMLFQLDLPVELNQQQLYALAKSFFICGILAERKRCHDISQNQ